MEIRQLRYFAQVADVGTFSGAAKELNLAQPSLWRAVKSLEAELGFQLFDSSPRGARLTRAGATLLGPARDLLEQVDALTRLGRELRQGREGLVVVGCPPPQIPTLVAPVIVDLHRRHPGIHVALRSTPSVPNVHEHLASHEELDFITSPVRIQGGVGRRFLAKANVVVKPAEDHPWRTRATIEVAELAQVPVVLTGPLTLSRWLIDRHVESLGISLDVILEADSLEAARAMAEAGVGVAVYALHGDDAENPHLPRLVHEGDEVSAPIWLYWLPDRPAHNPAARRFLDTLARSDQRTFGGEGTERPGE